MRSTGLSVAAMAAVILVGCAPTDDTEEIVRRTLEQSSIRGVNVSVAGEPRIIHLTGTVETIADRVRAEELATAIVGTTGRVRNEIHVDGLGPAGSARQ